MTPQVLNKLSERCQRGPDLPPTEQIKCAIELILQSPGDTMEADLKGFSYLLDLVDVLFDENLDLVDVLFDENLKYDITGKSSEISDPAVAFSEIAQNFLGSTELPSDQLIEAIYKGLFAQERMYGLLRKDIPPDLWRIMVKADLVRIFWDRWGESHGVDVPKINDKCLKWSYINLLTRYVRPALSTLMDEGGYFYRGKKRIARDPTYDPLNYEETNGPIYNLIDLYERVLSETIKFVNPRGWYEEDDSAILNHTTPLVTDYKAQLGVFIANLLLLRKFEAAVDLQRILASSINPPEVGES